MTIRPITSTSDNPSNTKGNIGCPSIPPLTASASENSESSKPSDTAAIPDRLAAMPDRFASTAASTRASMSMSSLIIGTSASSLVASSSGVTSRLVASPDSASVTIRRNTMSVAIVVVIVSASSVPAFAARSASKFLSSAPRFWNSWMTAVLPDTSSKSSEAASNTGIC